jgi:TatD DNase family protein
MAAAEATCPLIDVHAHLMDDALRESLPSVLDEARSRGVSCVVGVPETVEQCKQFLELDCSFAPMDMVFYCLGLHPVQPGWRSASVADVGPVLELLRREAGHPRVVGVGEVGLDFCPRTLSDVSSAVPRGEDTIKSEQVCVFRAQVRVARALGLPLNVHSRSAGHHALSLLIEEGAGLGVTSRSSGEDAECDALLASAGIDMERAPPHGTGAVLHAFDGKARYVRQGVERGFYFSVPPSAVRSSVMQKWIQACPLDRLLLETDSPALPAVQGEVNTPSELPVALKEVARLHDRPLAEVAEAVLSNTRKLFPKLCSVAKEAIG